MHRSSPFHKQAVHELIFYLQEIPYLAVGDRNYLIRQLTKQLQSNKSKIHC
jgi:hypothetical protein